MATDLKPGDKVRLIRRGTAGGGNAYGVEVGSVLEVVRISTDGSEFLTNYTDRSGRTDGRWWYNVEDVEKVDKVMNDFQKKVWDYLARIDASVERTNALRLLTIEGFFTPGPSDDESLETLKALLAEGNITRGVCAPGLDRFKRAILPAESPTVKVTVEVELTLAERAAGGVRSDFWEATPVAEAMEGMVINNVARHHVPRNIPKGARWKVTSATATFPDGPSDDPPSGSLDAHPRVSGDWPTPGT
jgi:hypothetical protein